MHKGSRYDLGGRLNTGREAHARKLEAQLPVGESVTVYYNPSDPADSVLNRGLSEDSSVRLAFSGILIATGIFVVRQNRRILKGNEAGLTT